MNRHYAAAGRAPGAFHAAAFAARGRRLAARAALLLCSLAGAASAVPQPCAPKLPYEMRGIWAECEGVNATLTSRAGIEEMFRRLEKARVNTVFLQVYRGDRAWYHSDIADAGPYDAFRAAEKTCPLRLAIDLAHARGMQLHAWVNVFRVWGGRDAKTIRALGKGAMTRDRGGRSILDYPRGALPDSGYWLDPGDPAVRGHVLRIVQELLDRYPDLDGIHLDYVRYPFDEKGKTEFGYGRKSVAAFKKATGAAPSRSTPAARALWDGWRRDQVTSCVAGAKRLAGARGKALSVAVIADEKKCRESTFQDWRRWLGEGLVDFVVPMNYSAERQLVLRRAAEALSAAGTGKRVAIGLGAYKVLDSPAALAAQVRDCRRLGALGVVLFSYDNMTRRPGLFAYLGREVF